MNKSLYIIALLSVKVAVCGDDPTAKDYWYGFAGDKFRQGMKHFEKGTENLNAGTGNLVQASKNLEGFPSEEAGKKFGEALGAGVVVGAAGAVKSGLLASPAAAKAAVVGAVTSPVAIPVAVGAATTGLFGYVGYIAWAVRRESQFNRCLSQHFDNGNLNERGFPRRCESPERNIRYHSNRVAETYIERFRAMKKKGLRPEKYWLGNDGLEDQKD